MPQPRDAALRLTPFHGVRFNPGIDLAAVTAPPYDVLDDGEVATLTSSDSHNIVRLVLPNARDRSTRDAAARATLAAWLADGTLLVDESPGLYVYEQSAAAAVRLRGIIGAVELVGPEDRVVLPHEDVMEWPVADRASLQTALEAHVEPIWLVYDGGGAASTVVDATVVGPTLMEARTPDGVLHRLWSVTDPAALAAVRGDLAGREAMIADGHHRYAAYRRVQAARREAGDGVGPWDFGLALLVDLRTHAPEVGAIHRVVRGLALDTATHLVGAAAGSVTSWTAALPELRPGSMVVVDDVGEAKLLPLPSAAERQALFTGTIGAGLPARWQALDTAFLHEVLLPS